MRRLRMFDFARRPARPSSARLRLAARARRALARSSSARLRLAAQWLRRLAVAALAAVLAGVALAALLPHLARSEWVGSRMRAGAREALGREVAYEDLALRLFPLALRLVRPSIAGARPGDAPFATADEAVVGLALESLLLPLPRVEAVIVAGATLRLVRSRAGISLPRIYALRELELRDATLRVEDRALSPVRSWELRRIEARARGDALRRRAHLEAALEAAGGGRAQVRGWVEAGGALDLALELDGFPLAPLGAYLGPGSDADGRVAGTARATGSRETLRVTGRLTLGGSGLQLREVGVRGPLSFSTEIRRVGGAPEARFEIDATAAELDYGGSLAKPGGVAARVEGRLLRAEGGEWAVDEVALRIGHPQGAKPPSSQASASRAAR